MTNASVLLTAQDIDPLLSTMAEQLGDRFSLPAARPPLIIGIHTGGVWVAEHLHRRLGLPEPVGTLDISFYRDDFTRIGMNPQVRPSNLPVSVDDRHIVLVDDVLHTGRTIRAALNEIFDYGRPASVILVTLVERPGRELPIEPDIVGRHLQPREHEHVKLIGPEPLALVFSDGAEAGRAASV